MLRVAVLLVASLSPAFARAAESWPVGRAPSREPSPYVYDAKETAKAPKQFFDDSSATSLYAGTSHLVEADGTIETITHEVTRLNGRKGVEKLGEFRGISFTPSHQKLTLNVARIHKASGKVVEVEPRHVHLRDVSTDYQVYDPEKQLIISFPGLEAGDTIDVKWTTRGKNPEHDGQFFTRYTLGDPQYPVLLDEVRIRLPKARALKYATVNGKLAPIITDGGDQRVYHWKMTDIDRVSRDENLPSKEELRLVVAASTFGSWEQVGLWKLKLRESCWKCAPSVKAVVADVTKDAKTPLDKARALTFWLRRNIRYNSAGEKHDYTPYPPEKVIANRFGDCKDTSQLLAVMFREVGIRVELATLGTYDDGQVHPDVPSPWGTHAILVATIDGKQHWIDTTAALNGWDLLPRDDMDRLCYLTDDKGKLRLLRSPAPTADGNKVEQVTDVSVGHDGTSRCRRTATHFGTASVRARDSYLEVPPGERRRQLTSKLQDANPKSRLLALHLDEKNLLNFDEPVKVGMEFEINRHFSGSPDFDGSVTDSTLWGKLLSYNIDPDRETPFVLPSPFESRHVFRFHLPAGYALDSVPRSKTAKSRWGTFSATVKALDEGDVVRNFEIVYLTRLDKTRVEPADLDEFRAFHEAINRDYRVWMTLKPVADLGSVPLLETTLQMSPENAFAASRVARIYLEAKRFVSQGDHKEARAVLLSITADGTPTQRAKAHYQLARSRYRKEELKSALEHLDLAAKDDSSVTDALRPQMLRGQILEESKRIPESIAAYKKAHAYEPQNQEVLLSLIRLSLVAKDEASAGDYLRRYTLLVGKDIGGLVLAAETYLKMGRYDEAFEFASRAREAGFSAKGQRLLGLLYLRKHEYAKAVHHLDKADPDSLVCAGLIRATIALGKVPELAGLVERAAKVDRPTPTLERAVRRARAVQSRREALGKVVELPADKTSALDALACAEDLFREQAPVALVESLLKADIGPAHALRARLALRQGKVRQALDDAEKAVKLCPEDASGYFARGRVRLERGESSALADLQKAAALGRDAETLAALAEALTAAGRIDEALKAARSALALRPGDKEIVEQVRSLEEQTRKKRAG